MRQVDTHLLKAIAWDFDGVLNRNVENGVFAWSRRFEEDLGLSLSSFSTHLFSGKFQRAMVGEACLKELVSDWVSEHGSPHDSDAILSYWFEQDALPDEDVLDIVSAMRARGIANIMATNNEIHRTNFIEHEMGFRNHMDRIFAAGRMRVAKPDPNYFRQIEQATGLSGPELLLVDDMQENTDAARLLGWKVFHFVEGSAADLRSALAV